MSRRGSDGSARRSVRRRLLAPFAGVLGVLGVLGAVGFFGAQAADRASAPVGLDSTPLEPGRRVEGLLGGDERKTYRLVLGKGELGWILVEQRGVDVVVTLRDPRGKVMIERDALTGAFGVESVRFVAPAAGTYSVTLRVLDPRAVRDRYAIRLAERRPARPEDVRAVAAQAAALEGTRLRVAVAPGSAARAARSSERARSLWKALGDREEEALACYELGAVARARGDNRLALEKFSAGLEPARAAGARQLETRLLDAIGLTKVFTGDAAGASDVLARAMALAHQAGDVQTENEARNSLGWAQSLLGRYQSAIETYQQAIAVARSRADRYAEAWPTSGLGFAYLKIGERRKALATYERALELWRSIPDRRGELLTLEDIGFLYWSAGDSDRALEIFERVLPIARAVGDGRGEALALNNIALVRSSLGNPAAARTELLSALVIWRRMSDRPGEIQSLHNLGRAEAALGRPEEALAIWEQELALLRASSNPDGESRALAAIAREQAQLGRLAEARARGEAAIAILERERSHLSERGLRSTFLSARQDSYAVLVDVLLKLGERGGSDGAREAFSVSERGRARSFLEALAASGASRPGAAGGGGASVPSVPSVATVAAVQARLPDDTALVSFWLGSERATAFVVGRGRFDAVALPVSVADLSERVGIYADLLSRGEAAPATVVGRRLYTDAVAPWRGLLAPGVRRLVLVPDRALHSLPFEALPRDGRLLLSDFSISYAPSASVFAARRPEAGRRTSPVAVLALADTRAPDGSGPGRETVTAFDGESFELAPLAHAGREARRAARFGGEGTRLLAGAEATETRLMSERPERFGVLHFATHGLLSVRSPDRSALRLSAARGSNGLLEARDIYRLRLSSDLVVLSACQSARGLVLPGEGVESLARAFLQAGARTVVATLWNVRDERAAELMDFFYTRLARGEAKADALRSAKLDLLRRHPDLPPTFWAPFVLIGEPDGVVPLVEPPWWSGLL